MSVKWIRRLQDSRGTAYLLGHALPLSVGVCLTVLSFGRSLRPNAIKNTLYSGSQTSETRLPFAAHLLLPACSASFEDLHASGDPRGFWTRMLRRRPLLDRSSGLVMACSLFDAFHRLERNAGRIDTVTMGHERRLQQLGTKETASRCRSA